MSGDTPGDTVADRHLHPATVVLRFLKNLPSTLIALPAIFTSMSNIGWGYFLLVMIASAAIFVCLYWLLWRRFTYGIGETEIVIQSGVFDRSRRTIPFDRIQDVDFERGPLQRTFGLARVRIETGGAARDEGLLDSLSIAEAERLRAAVRAGQGRAMPVAADVEAAADAPLFTMALPMVLIAGLFKFSLLWMAGIFALLQQFERFLPFDIYDLGSWIGLAEDRLTGRVTIGLIAALLLAAIPLGLLSGMVSSVLRDFGFRLGAEPHGFRRERGLMTRTEVVIPKRWIQLALIQSGPLRRRIGHRALHFQLLGSGEQKGDGGLQNAAPFARLAEIDTILEETHGLRRPDPAILQRVSGRHVSKAVASVLLTLLPVLMASLFHAPAILAAFAVPLLVAAAIVERRCHRYAFENDLIFIESGWWRRKSWILPVRGIQTVTIRRTWLQRRLDIASLRFDTAGAAMMGGPEIKNMRVTMAENLAAALSARNRPMERGR